MASASSTRSSEYAYVRAYTRVRTYRATRNVWLDDVTRSRRVQRLWPASDQPAGQMATGGAVPYQALPLLQFFTYKICACERERERLGTRLHNSLPLAVIPTNRNHCFAQTQLNVYAVFCYRGCTHIAGTLCTKYIHNTVHTEMC